MAAGKTDICVGWCIKGINVEVILALKTTRYTSGIA
jgi:hypothetical protein